MPDTKTKDPSVLKTVSVRTEAGLLTYRLVAVTSRVGVRYFTRVSYTGEDGSDGAADSGRTFYDVGKALVYLRDLSDGLVTPIDLPYIEEDRFDL